MTVTTVTPWLEHRELAAGYLAALHAGPFPDEAIVVDNGGAPDLPGCRVFDAAHNLGFAGGSNLGLLDATSEVVVFLNNDIVHARDGWLLELVAAVEPMVLAGPVRYDRHADVDGQPFPYIDGWCLAGTRDDLTELGGFDDSLEEPAYYSDNLLCLEARAAGMVLRDVRVGLRHLESVTSEPTNNLLVQRASAANRARYVTRVRELTAAPAQRVVV